VFFYLYNYLKDLHARRGGQLGPFQNMVIAALAGAANAVLTNPVGSMTLHYFLD
jgi:hypothetical protein